jgi:hypothetical protein
MRSRSERLTGGLTFGAFEADFASRSPRRASNGLPIESPAGFGERQKEKLIFARSPSEPVPTLWRIRKSEISAKRTDPIAVTC